MAKCIFPNCKKAEHAKKYCNTHYRRYKKHGDASRVDPPGEKAKSFCIWITTLGYPKIRLNGKEYWLHRWLWERYKGPIPPGYVVHHKDENKLNFAIENLELLSISTHRKLHMKGNQLARGNQNTKRKENTGSKKYCPKCKTVKVKKDFVRNRAKWDDMSVYCRPCLATYKRERKLNSNAK